MKKTTKHLLRYSTLTAVFFCCLFALTAQAADPEFEWVERLGGSSNDTSRGVAVDSSGNVYAAGIVYGTGDLNGDGDTSDTDETQVSPYGVGDIYLSKFNSTGVHQWSQRLGGAGNDDARGITVDSSDNVYIAGNVNGTADLNGDGDTSDSHETPTATYGGDDIVLLKFNSSGVLQWSERLGGTGGNKGYAVATHTNGDVYITGYTVGWSDLNGDNDTNDTDEIPSGITQADIFISKFNSSGTPQWHERLGGNNGDYGWDVTVDSSGNVYVVCDVTTTADLNGDGDTGDAHETANPIYGGIYDIVLVKFNSSGTFLWNERLGAASVDYGRGVAVDSNDNVYVAGIVTGAADLNGDGDTNDTNESAGSPYGDLDAIITKFDSSGTHQWAERLGGGDADFGNRVVVDSEDNVYMSGMVGGTADLNGDGDEGDENETQASPYGTRDALIWKFDSTGTHQWNERLGGSNNDYGNGIAMDSSDNLFFTAYVDDDADLNGDGDTSDAEEVSSSPYGGADVVVIKFAGPVVTDDSDLIDINIDITATLSIACDPSVTMGSIAGTGQSTLTTNYSDCNVTTNNTAGYQVQWTATAADLQAGGLDDIDAYTPASDNTPETWSVATADAEWGARPDSTNSSFTDAWGVDGLSDENTEWGSTDTYSGNWLDIDTTARIILDTNDPSQTGGDTLRVLYGAEIGTGKVQPSGSYDQDVTYTATTL